MDNWEMDRMNGHSGYRGDRLLGKWLQGTITRDEERELLDLAEVDPMLREALEGYIGQKVFKKSALPEPVLRELHPERLTRKGNQPARYTWVRYAAAVIVLVFAIGFLAAMLTTERGQPAEPFVVDIELPLHPGTGEQPDRLQVAEAVDAGTQRSEPAAALQDGGAEVNNERAQKPAAPAVNTAYIETHIAEAGETEVAQSGAELSGKAADQLAADLRSVPGTEGSLLPDGGSDLSLSDGSGSFIDSGSEEFADAESPDAAQESVVPQVPDREIALQFFDYEADEVLRREVQMEALREGDQPITGYEFDIRTGISPDALSAGGLVDAASGAPEEDVDLVGLQSKANLADAAGNRAAVDRTNMIAKNVVVTEYKIQKRDITHPPVEDYNSLVREKYKRKAKPETGYYQYKKYLRKATSCLVRNHHQVETLEEAIIKFRVFDNGDIEFIELFGTDGNTCTDQISADITSGPKWQLADHYESIDIEVPLKVLYPYWY